MSWLKRCFIQRFSFFDVLTYTILTSLYVTEAITFVGFSLGIVVSVMISVIGENHLDVRDLNGNSQVSK